MSTETPATAAKPDAAAPAAPSKPSAIGGLMRILIPAILAAAASYGGARGAVAHAAAAPAPAAEHEKAEGHAPGPTVTLDPFLVTIHDSSKKAHVMKLSVAVEFKELAKEEELKGFAPRIRDAILGYIRGLSFEEAAEGAGMEKMRTELLERCKKAGASGAERVLVTDFVLQ